MCVPAIGTSSQAVMQAWIAAARGDYTTVRWVPVPFGATIDAIKVGRCDGALLPSPFYEVGRAAGFIDIGNPVFAFGPPGAPSGSIATSAAYAERNGPVVKRFIGAMKEAIRFAAAHPAVVRDLLPSYTGLTPEQTRNAILPLYFAPFYLKSLQNLADWVHKVGFITSPLNVTSMIADGAPVVKNK
jgi:NitT/TauT family transport system substrate-binding protein